MNIIKVFYIAIASLAGLFTLVVLGHWIAYIIIKLLRPDNRK